MKKILSLLIFFPFIALGQRGYIRTIAGTGTAGYSGDGSPATAALINGPHGIIEDASGNLYIADNYANVIRKISPSGIISTFAGTGTAGFSGDGGPATAALLTKPFQMAFDNRGNFYFTEDYLRVRKINTSGIISTIAGTGTRGYGGDGGPATAASFDRPEGLVIDAIGNIYISDFMSSRIRKIDTSGIIYTIAGTGTYGYSGDGGAATSAQLSYPNFLYFDHLGNLIFSDNDNQCVRKINSSGIISTVAGLGGRMSYGFSGDGGPATDAKLYFPCGITEDLYHNLLISDLDNSVLRKIDSAGIITTLYGNPIRGYSGDGGPATSALFNKLAFTYVRKNGNFVLSDLDNHAIREVSSGPDHQSDSLNIFLNVNCLGVQIDVLPCRFHAGSWIKTLFQDGTTSIDSVNGTSWKAVVSHNFTSSGNFSIKQIYYIGSTPTDSTMYSLPFNFCNTFSLKTFYDANSDCVKNSTETYLNKPLHIVVDSNGTTIDTVSLTAGLYYNAYGTVGDVYRFRLTDPSGSVHTVCPGTGFIYDTLGYTNTSEKYFGVVCDSPASVDFTIRRALSTIANGVQSGSFYVRNLNCEYSGGVLTYNFDSRYSFGSSTPNALASGTGFAKWTVPSINMLDTTAFKINFILNSSGLSARDVVRSTGCAVTSNYDVDTSNNSQEYTDTVRLSNDPNYVEVNKPCFDDTTTVQQLEYTIHFENTGNDTAHNIYVMDTISNLLNPRTLEIVLASHQMMVSYLHDSAGHNIVKFDFPRINLRDSSHHGECDGAVMYTIKTRNGLRTGNTINNRAGIYFDFNDVVITNTTVTTVGCPVVSYVQHIASSNEIRVYPNPASNTLNISTGTNQFESYSITNTLGREMLASNLVSPLNKVDISSLPIGVYFVTLHGKNGVEVKKFVKE